MSNSRALLCLFAVLWCSTQVSSVSAQDITKLRGYAKPCPNPNSTHDLSQLLEYPEIASELGVDLEKFHQINEEAASIMHQKMLEIKGDTSEERMAQLIRVTKEWTAKQEATLEELLTPEQLRRLKQIAFRIEAGRIGLYGALREGWLGESVRLENPERDQVLKKAAAIDVEMRAKIKALNAEAEARILALLTPADKREVQRLLGASIDVELRTPEELRLEKLKQRAKVNDTDKKDGL